MQTDGMGYINKREYGTYPNSRCGGLFVREIIILE